MSPEGKNCSGLNITDWEQYGLRVIVLVRKKIGSVPCFVKVTEWSIPGMKASHQSGIWSQKMSGRHTLIKKEIPFESFSHPLVHPNILRSAIIVLIKDPIYESQKQGYWWSLPLRFISLSNQTVEGIVNLQGKIQAQTCQSGLPQ